MGLLDPFSALHVCAEIAGDPATPNSCNRLSDIRDFNAVSRYHFNRSRILTGYDYGTKTRRP